MAYVSVVVAVSVAALIAAVCLVVKTVRINATIRRQIKELKDDLARAEATCERERQRLVEAAMRDAAQRDYVQYAKGSQSVSLPVDNAGSASTSTAMRVSTANVKPTTRPAVPTTRLKKRGHTSHRKPDAPSHVQEPSAAPRSSDDSGLDLTNLMLTEVALSSLESTSDSGNNNNDTTDQFAGGSGGESGGAGAGGGWDAPDTSSDSSSTSSGFDSLDSCGGDSGMTDS